MFIIDHQPLSFFFKPVVLLTLLFVSYLKYPLVDSPSTGGIGGAQRSAKDLTAAPPFLPPDWNTVQSGNGVVLGSRSYTRSGGTSIDYAQVVDLSTGARVRLRQGNLNIATPANPSPFYAFKRLATSTGTGWYWPTYAKRKSFGMATLQFFNFRNGALSFPIKDNGTLVTCGSSNHEPNAKRKLGINGSTIVVADYTNTSNNYSTVASNLISPTVIVGLHPDVPKSPQVLMGRSYLAYKNSRLVIYTTRRATQAQVRNILITEFGINDADILMMDGSGSAQLVCRGINYVNSTDGRLIPSGIETIEY